MKTIILDKVSKNFRIGFKKRQGTLNHFISFFSGKNQNKALQVLKNISFSVEEGEVIGIIGNNGSGKSTLLRIISGIYTADKGELRTIGNVISLINLGVGLKERLTMKDNIYLFGALFGIERNSIKKNFQNIVQFSGLEKFINTQIYQFSEGMIQRLVFSIAIYSNPNILLLDEVFEIGDEDFKRKSAEKIKELVEKGATAVLVSHDMIMIERYCSKTLWLNEGHIKNYGKSKIIIENYLNNERRNKLSLPI